jgi:hypothetical protein
MGAVDQIASVAAKAATLGEHAARHDGVVVVAGDTIKPQAVRWLWPGWLARGKLHILAGEPGQGKTTIALALAATVTAGGRFPDGSRCDPANVLVWSGEDDVADTLLPRLIAMGADRRRVHFVQGARVAGVLQPFDPARDLVQLTAEAQRIGNVALLILDPVVGAVTGDSHKNTEVRRGLQPVVDLAAAIDAACIGVTHFAKGSAGRNPVERVVGSIAFSAVARIVMVAATTTDENGAEQRVFARAKANIAANGGGFVYSIEQDEVQPGIHASRVLWGEAVTGSALDLIGEPASEEHRSATSEAIDALRLILGSDVVPRDAAVAKMKSEGFSEKVTRTARERLGVIVKRSGFGKDMTTYWSLPGSPVVPSPAIRAQKCPTFRLGTTGHDCEVEGTNEASDGGDDHDAEVF